MEAEKDVVVREAPSLTDEAPSEGGSQPRSFDLRAIAGKAANQASPNADINMASQSVSRTMAPGQPDQKRPHTAKMADAVVAMMKKRKKKKMVARSGIAAFFKGEGKEEGANNQNPEQEAVSFGKKVEKFLATAKKKVNALLIEGTSVHIFFFFAGILMTFTMFYIIQYIIVQAIAQYTNPPGQFSIEYASSLETPAVRICPDQRGIDIIFAESNGFKPACLTLKDNEIDGNCGYTKTPDIFGDNTTNTCYVFNTQKAVQDKILFTETGQSIFIAFFAKANTSDPDLAYLGVPFTLFHDTEYDPSDELPRTGYIPFGYSAMATVTLDKHISLSGDQTWYFTTPGLTTLEMSEELLASAMNTLVIDDEIKPLMHLHVLNIRFASLQVTTTQEYIPLGPLEIIAALGGILSLASGILQSLYPPAERLKRRFIFDVVEEQEVEEVENPASPRAKQS